MNSPQRDSIPAPTAQPSWLTIAVSVGVAMGGIYLYYWLIWSSFEGFLLSIDFCHIPFCDFVAFFYEMGKEVFRTKTPVTGFYYSPFFAIVLGFFGTMDLSTATAIWAGLVVSTSIAVAVVSYWLVRPQNRIMIIPFAIVFLTSFPLIHNFKWGQVGVLIVILVLLCLLAYEKEKWLLSAFLLAVAVSIKYYPVIFAIPFLFRRDFKFLFAFGISLVVLILGLPAIVLGAKETLNFIYQLAGGTYSKTVYAGGPNSQYVANVLMRLREWPLEAVETVRAVFTTIGFLILELNIIMLVFVRRLVMTRKLHWEFFILLLSTPFFVTTSWPHYLVYFPFCQLFLFDYAWRGEGMSTVTRRVLLSIVGVSVLFSSVVMFDLAGGRNGYPGAGYLFWSNTLLLIAGYIVLLPRVIQKWKEKSAVAVPPRP